MTDVLGLGKFVVIAVKGGTEKRSKPLSYKAAVARMGGGEMVYIARSIGQQERHRMKPLSNTYLVSRARILRKNYDMGCAYLIGDAGRAAMLTMYMRLKAAYKAKPTENLKREMTRFESFYVVAEYFAALGKND